ncbi:hypothetical protein WJX72_011260 [[Myrmecia] bisecta]|uniref:Late embryogenesis abundant protein n=1 Tax=[Myrmecia] bisecta TaxID=41462 RepID=A0AAW1PEI4_9CHLO
MSSNNSIRGLNVTVDQALDTRPAVRDMPSAEPHADGAQAQVDKFQTRLEDLVSKQIQSGDQQGAQRLQETVAACVAEARQTAKLQDAVARAIELITKEVDASGMPSTEATGKQASGAGASGVSGAVKQAGQALGNAIQKTVGGQAVEFLHEEEDTYCVQTAISPLHATERAKHVREEQQQHMLEHANQLNVVKPVDRRQRPVASGTPMPQGAKGDGPAEPAADSGVNLNTWQTGAPMKETQGAKAAAHKNMQQVLDSED